jgi:hypothetical protein
MQTSMPPAKDNTSEEQRRLIAKQRDYQSAALDIFGAGVSMNPYTF